MTEIEDALTMLDEVAYFSGDIPEGIRRRVRLARQVLAEAADKLSWQDWELKDAEVALQDSERAWVEEKEAHAETRAELQQAYDDMHKMREAGLMGHRPKKIGAPNVVPNPAPPTPRGRVKTITPGVWSAPKHMTFTWSFPTSQVYDLISGGVSLPDIFAPRGGGVSYTPLLADKAELNTAQERVELPRIQASETPGLKRLAAEGYWKRNER